MAELLLKIKDTPTYDDGDIVCAFNDRRISQVHVQHICHPTTVGFNSDGMRDHDTLVEVFLANTYQFKFERVSKTEVKRYNLLTGDVDLISDTPNADGEYMDVEMFIKRRRGHKRHLIFGSFGNEIWYGGRSDCSAEKLDTVWADIEDRTDERKADHNLWPLTNLEKCHFLGLSVDAFDDDEAGVLTESEMDNNDPEKPVVIKKRKKVVVYKDMTVISAGTQGHIANPDILVDVRGPGNDK